ncbi:MAG: hypothetical protein HF967_06935 [Methanosarcinales archaeon]|jgi:peptide/nickel transport system substrate-binding protein|nr:hypothetical protein [Methanosarcinales archaeon]
MLNKKIISLSICIVLLGAMFSGCVEEQTDEVKIEVPQELTIGISSDPGRGAHYGLLGAHVYETLVGVAPGVLEPIPMLATHWNISQDRLTWTFHLRQGVKFHDGTPFTSEAVKFSFERMLEMFEPAHGILQIESMKILDSHTINITTTRPWAALIAHLSHPVGHIMNPTSFDEEENIIKHIGTGPFKYYKHCIEERLIVVRNENHWQGVPKLEKITFAIIPDAHTRIMALEAGEIDVTQWVPPEEVAWLDARPGITVLTTPSVRTDFLIFNSETKPFDNILVRQAVNYAINQGDLVEYLLDGHGIPARGAISPTIRWSIHEDLPEFRFNPEKAKELLSEAGWEDTDDDGILDKNGESFSITFLLSGRLPHWVPIAEAIQAQLREVGIIVELKVLEFGALRDAAGTPEDRPLDKHLFFSSSGTWAGDADYILYLTYHTNFNRWSSRHIDADELIEKGLGTINDNERFVIWGDVQRKILETDLAVYLLIQQEIVAIRDHVHGFQAHPNQRMAHVPLWEVYVTG